MIRRLKRKEVIEILENGNKNLSYLDLSNLNLSDLDLSNCNFSHCNLLNTILSYSNLSKANFFYANLKGAELKGADLYKANLARANLSNTDFSFADLSFANLCEAILYEGNLSDANLNFANLFCAILEKANLSNTNLSNASLSYADLKDAILDEKEQIRKGMVLEEPMIGYKKCRGDIIVTLEIPKGASVFSINNSKCRTNKAKVIGISNEKKIAHSQYDKFFTYELGQEIEIEHFDFAYNLECARGIHFFKTQKEAEEYEKPKVKITTI